MAEYESGDDDDVPSADPSPSSSNDGSVTDALRRQRLDNAYSAESLAKRIRVAKKKKKDYMGLEPKLRAQLEAAQKDADTEDERKTHRRLLADHKQVLVAGKVDYVRMTPLEQMAAKLSATGTGTASGSNASAMDDNGTIIASNDTNSTLTDDTPTVAVATAPLSTANPLSLLSPPTSSTTPSSTPSSTIAAVVSVTPSLASIPRVATVVSSSNAASVQQHQLSPVAVVDFANKVDDIASVVDDLFASDDDEPPVTIAPTPPVALSAPIASQASQSSSSIVSPIVAASPQVVATPIEQSSSVIPPSVAATTIAPPSAAAAAAAAAADDGIIAIPAVVVATSNSDNKDQPHASAAANDASPNSKDNDDEEEDVNVAAASKKKKKKKKKKRIAGAPTNTEDLVDAMDADADMEIRGGAMDLAQVRAEQEQRPPQKQYSLQELLDITYTRGRDALFAAFAEAKFDISSMMYYGNLVPRMADLKRKREADEHAARVKAEANGQKYHSVPHDLQFEGRMILHQKRATNPNRKWTSFEDYDIDLDKSLPTNYIPRDLGDMIPMAIKYGKDPILFLMSKMGHQKPELLTIDLAIDAYDLMLEDEHASISRQRAQMNLPPPPPRQRILSIAAAPPSAAPAAIAAANATAAARPLSGISGGHSLGGSSGGNASGTSGTSGGGTSAIRNRPLPAGLGLPRLARGTSSSSSSMISSSATPSLSSSNDSTTVGITGTPIALPATTVAPVVAAPAVTSSSPSPVSPAIPAIIIKEEDVIRVTVNLSSVTDTEPVVVTLTLTAVAASSPPVTVPRSKAVSAALVDQIAQQLQAERNRASYTSGPPNSYDSYDPYDIMRAQQSAMTASRSGSGIASGGMRGTGQTSGNRPMGGIHSISSAAPADAKRQFTPQPMPPAAAAATATARNVALASSIPTIDPQTVITLDGDEKKHTKIAIRLLAGRRVVGKFNNTSTVGDIRRFVDAACGAGTPPYRLYNSMPKKELTDASLTILKAGLANGTVLQELVR